MWLKYRNMLIMVMYVLSLEVISNSAKSSYMTLIFESYLPDNIHLEFCICGWSVMHFTEMI